MAVDLPSLPIELVLNIVSCEAGSSRQKLCEALRFTCKELNNKVIRYYGHNHYKRIQIPLSKAGFNSFLRISEGPLAPHVRSLTFDCRKTNTDVDAWCFTSTCNENIMKCFKSDRYISTVGPALSKLPNLDRIHFGASYYDILVDDIRVFCSELGGA